MTDKEELRIAIGNRIRKLREVKNISQQDLAFDCNIEKSNYHRIESGRTNPTIYTLQRIAINLGITLSELVNIEN